VDKSALSVEMPDVDVTACFTDLATEVRIPDSVVILVLRDPEIGKEGNETEPNEIFFNLCSFIVFFGDVVRSISTCGKQLMSPRTEHFKDACEMLFNGDSVRSISK